MKVRGNREGKTKGGRVKQTTGLSERKEKSGREDFEGVHVNETTGTKERRKIIGTERLKEF